MHIQNMSEISELFLRSRNLRIYNLFISSENRISPNSTSSTDFKVPIINNILGRYVAYALKQATIPKTFYNITAGRNTIEILDSVNTKTIVVPPGNYDMATLLSTITALINAASPDTFTFAYDTITGRITATSTFANFAINPNALGVESLVIDYLGWNLNTAYVSSTGSLTAPNAADISGLKVVFIEIQELQRFSQNTSNAFHNFIVPVNGQFGDVIFYSDNSNFHQFFNIIGSEQSSLSLFTVRLVDQYGIPIDLNGREWEFTLQLITNS